MIKTWRWPNFTIEEMRCRLSGECLINEAFMDKLQLLRDRLNHPMIISSGYRSPKYNDQISGTGLNGPHTIGAADVVISGELAFTLVKLALEVGMTGIGVRQHGKYSKRMVHLDDLDNELRPRIWTY